jgi:nitroreductase
MTVQEAIATRRAYRSLDPVEITRDTVEDLARHAQLSPSCFNSQPWRYVFVYEPPMLERMHEALSEGNAWAKDASMIIAVHCADEDDCIVKERRYAQFDTGLATAFLVLRATELGLVAHPIAGYSPRKTKKILGIPGDHEVITLVIVGKHAEKPKPSLSEQQAEQEAERPPRKALAEFVSHNRFGEE